MPQLLLLKLKSWRGFLLFICVNLILAKVWAFQTSGCPKFGV